MARIATMFPTSQIKLILLRWWSMISCGIVSAIIWKIFESTDFSSLISEFIHKNDPLLILISISVLIIAIVWPMGKSRWSAFFGLSYFWSYPPLWVAVIVGSASLDYIRLVEGKSPPILSLLTIEHYWLLALVPASILISIVKHVIEDSPIKQNLKGGTSTFSQETITELFEWIDNDNEIFDPRLDKFGHNVVAERIAARITNCADPPTIAVVGPLGTGKSTIGNFVSSLLQSDKNIIFVRLSLWPFDTAEAAVTGVLNEMIQNIGNKVNITSLSNLSSNYISAIEKAAGGRIGALFLLIQKNKRPDQILDQLANVVTVIGCRFVLWIDDLERFAGTDQMTDEKAMVRESERLGPIRPLFYQLDRKRSISVIIADTSLRTRYDVEKIARFVETTPRLSVDDVYPILKTFRTNCLTGWPKSIIDPALPEQREQFFPERLGNSRDTAYIFAKFNAISLLDAVVSLFVTPRVMKSSLRLVKEIWSELAGEIDFDDVLVCSVLKVASPDVFSFIDVHIDHFRSKFFAEENNGEKSSVYLQFQSLLNVQSSSGAIMELVDFLFPSASIQNHRNYSTKLQGISIVSIYVDYWQRFLSVPNIDDTISDQAAIRSILDWQNGRGNDLVKRITSSDSFHKIEQFVSLFKGNDLCKLLEEVSEELKDKLIERPIGMEQELQRGGVLSIWRMVDRLPQPPDQSLLINTLIPLVQRYVLVNLLVVEDIIHYFGSTSPDVRDRLNEENRKKLFETLHQVLLENFVPGGAKKLLSALKSGPPYILYWLVWGLGRIRAEDMNDFPFQGWDNFSKVLLDMAEETPERGVPIIVLFVTTRKETSIGRIPEWDNEKAQRLFDYERLLRILANVELPISSIDDQLSQSLDVAKKEASSRQGGIGLS